MINLAIVGVTFSIVAGLALASYHFWRRRKWESALLLFFLPVLAYFLWHFSVEAYNWGEVWTMTQELSNSQELTLQMNMAMALIDLKLIFSVFLILFWVFVWKSVNRAGGNEKHRSK